MKSSDLFVKCLEAEGVEYIFGVPGEENLDLLESLSNSKIKVITTRHEQTAGFMAATYGRLTGNVGVCLSTLGPGSTNFMTAVAYAQLGAMPVLFITGQKPLNRSKQGSFQIIKTVDIMEPITKYTTQITSGALIPSRIRQAIKLAEEERPGAVHIELPEDIAAETVENLEPMTPTKPRRPVADTKAIDQAVEMIKASHSPLLLIGAGANRKLASKMLTHFVNSTHIPFFNTQMGKGVIDERNPHFLGTAALSENDYIHCVIDKADLIINVGHDTIEKPPFIMRQSDSRKVIHINFFASPVDPIYFPQLEVVGDIANAVWHITEKLQGKTWENPYAEKVKSLLDSQISSGAAQTSFPLSPQVVVSDIRKSLGDEDILTLDNGMYKIWFARNFKATSRNTILLDNALATMGAGVASAIAAKMIHPDKHVVSVCGDGGFMMNSQELETAVRLNLDLVIIILNDNGYGMIKWKQKAAGFKNFGLEFTNPDFVTYAHAYGAKGYRLTEKDNLTDLIKQYQKKGGVHIIEVPIDYSDNEKVLIKELKEKTCDL